MSVGRRGTCVWLLAFLCVCVMTPIAIAGSHDVEIVVEYADSSAFPTSESFTASGGAVDMGIIPASGQVDDIQSSLQVLGTQGPILKLQMVKHFICGTAGTFDLKLIIDLNQTTGYTTATWTVVAGTGTYSGLQGSGTLAGTPTGNGGIVDVYTGAFGTEEVESCTACPATENITYYIGSDPSSTYLTGTKTLATQVDESLWSYGSPFAVWSTLGMGNACGSKWVSVASDGVFDGVRSFTDLFDLPAGMTVVAACIEISADDWAIVKVNGYQVGVHQDLNGTYSGSDEVSAFDVPPAYFQSGVNELVVIVTNEPSYGGAVWCMQVCCEQDIVPCGSWNRPAVSLSSGAWSGQVTSCRDSVSIPADVCASGYITITPHYSCDSVTGSPAIQPSYEIVSPLGEKYSFVGSYSMPVSWLNEGCTNLCITAYCGEKACDTCCFQLCCEQAAACECGSWSGNKITLSSGSWTYGVRFCGSTIALPNDVCSSSSMSVTPHFECSSSDPEICTVSYTINDPTKPGLQPFTGSYDFPIDGISGPYEICVRAYCDDTRCEECCFTVECEEMPSCECGSWGTPIVELKSGSWSYNVRRCGTEVSLPVDVCESEYLGITPDFDCDPVDPDLCPDWYEINDPQSGWTQFTGTYDFPIHQIAGEYEICLRAWCGEEYCEECCFVVECQEMAACECGKWDRPAIVLQCSPFWDGTVSCGTEAHVPLQYLAEYDLNIVPLYQCDPEDCEPTYVIDCELVSDQFTGDYDLFVGDRHDPLEICIFPFCEEMECEPCCIVVIPEG